MGIEPTLLESQSSFLTIGRLPPYLLLERVRRFELLRKPWQGYMQPLHLTRVYVLN
jgi:hypothetical protein